MKNINKLIGIIAALAVIGLVFISCPEESDGFSAPGLLGTKKPTEIPNFESSPVSSLSQAQQLLSAFYNIQYEFERAIDDLLEKASEAKYGPMSEYMTANADKKSLSMSYDSKDFAKLKTILDEDYDITVTTGKVTASSSMSWSSNLTLSEFNTKQNNGTLAVGDKYSVNQKSKVSLEITGTPAEYNDYYWGNIKVAGFVVSENEMKSSYTLKEKAGSALDNDREETSSIHIAKEAFSISIDNGTYGAKIVFSSSTAIDSSSRSSKGTYGSNISDILFYNNAGDLLFTIIN